MEHKMSISSSSISYLDARPKSAPMAGLPWGTLIATAGLTLFTCAKITQSGAFFTTVNLLSTFLFLIAAIIGVVFWPLQTTRTFFCLYLGLRLFSITGLLGYETSIYTSLVIAVVLSWYVQSQRKSVAGLPGTGLVLGLAALVTLQFFRATSFRGALPILCDVIAFALVIWKFQAIPERIFRICIEGFIAGVLAAGLILFLRSSEPETRLGSEFGFNPNDLGSLVGAALLFATSGYFFNNKRWLLRCAVPLLLVLLVATGSRTSIFAYFACAGIFLALKRARVFLVLLLCGSIVLGYLTYRGVLDTDPESLGGRLASPFSESFEDSGAHRAVIWAFLLTQVPHYWKGGVGLRNIENLTEEYGIISVQDAINNVRTGSQSHNIYLTSLLEFGILGLVLLLVWQGRVFAFVIKQRTQYSFLLAVMLYFLIQGFFQGLNLNFVFGFLLVAAFVASRDSQRYSKLPASM
jgi:O-antigen ligase